MSRTFHHGKRNVRINAKHRDYPDLRRMARAMIDLARAQTEAEAKAEHGKGRTGSPSDKDKQSQHTSRKGDAA